MIYVKRTYAGCPMFTKFFYWLFFNINHILSHKGKRFNITDEDIQEIVIDFITFKDLTERYSIKSIDKLQLDVEGAEYKILNSIDFNKVKINQIFFESKHFDGTFLEGKKLEETKKMLEINGYTLEKVDNENILAKKIISDWAVKLFCAFYPYNSLMVW